MAFYGFHHRRYKIIFTHVVYFFKISGFYQSPVLVLRLLVGVVVAAWRLLLVGSVPVLNECFGIFYRFIIRKQVRKSIGSFSAN